MKASIYAVIIGAAIAAYACSRQSKADGGHDLACAQVSAGTLSADVHRCENDEVVCYAMGAALSCVRR